MAERKYLDALSEVGRIAPIEPAAPKGRGGKRSDPGWRQVSFFLRPQTHRLARRKAEDDGRDLSDVLQELLERWVED